MFSLVSGLVGVGGTERAGGRCGAGRRPSRAPRGRGCARPIGRSRTRRISTAGRSANHRTIARGHEREVPSRPRGEVSPAVPDSVTGRLARSPQSDESGPPPPAAVVPSARPGTGPGCPCRSVDAVAARLSRCGVPVSAATARSSRAHQRSRTRRRATMAVQRVHVTGAWVSFQRRPGWSAGHVGTTAPARPGGLAARWTRPRRALTVCWSPVAVARRVAGTAVPGGAAARSATVIGGRRFTDRFPSRVVSRRRGRTAGSAPARVRGRPARAAGRPSPARRGGSCVPIWLGRAGTARHDGAPRWTSRPSRCCPAARPPGPGLGP